MFVYILHTNTKTKNIVDVNNCSTNKKLACQPFSNQFDQYIAANWFDCVRTKLCPAVESVLMAIS